MNTHPHAAGEIRVAPASTCAVCGGLGELLHARLTDRLFDAPGEWNLSRCRNPTCGLVWPDPMPLTEDLGKAYTTYYTHVSRRGSPKGFLRKLLREIVHGYWALKYQYPARTPYLSKSLGILLYLWPLRRSTADQDVRLLKAVPGGSVLDVGCGSGDWLVEMQELGWRPEGVDFDEKAVKAARDRKLKAECGILEQQNYASESFDAATLNHVIEHVPDPCGTLEECFRVLKPGGNIVFFTPNAASFSHRFFGRDWRGLEPPRHLHIFTRGALKEILEKAGWTTFPGSEPDREVAEACVNLINVAK